MLEHIQIDRPLTPDGYLAQNKFWRYVGLLMHSDFEPTRVHFAQTKTKITIRQKEKQNDDDCL